MRGNRKPRSCFLSGPGLGCKSEGRKEGRKAQEAIFLLSAKCTTEADEAGRKEEEGSKSAAIEKRRRRRRKL